ncbi:MAG: hypothetical protein ACON5B_07420 [Myxococcota bacterium]
MTSAREAFMPSVLPENMGATTRHIVAHAGNILVEIASIWTAADVAVSSWEVDAWEEGPDWVATCFTRYACVQRQTGLTSTLTVTHSYDGHMGETLHTVQLLFQTHSEEARIRWSLGDVVPSSSATTILGRAESRVTTHIDGVSAEHAAALERILQQAFA